MSRNGHFRMGAPLGGAYAPDAETSSEGDILHGLREDDADVRILGVSAYDLKGLREDDARVRLGMNEPGGTAYDGASGSAEGSAEGHEVAQMGISAYDAQPGVLVSDGRMGGMVEDHYNTRLMAGLREDDADVRILGVSAYDLKGLREDDANMELLAGLREDDANLRLGGLREDDADVRVLATAYADDSAGSAEDPASRAGMGVSAYDLGVSAYDLRGLREDDANLRLGGVDLGISAYDLGISAYDLGDVDSLSAEAAAIEQQQTLGDMEVGKKKGMKLRNIARNAARIAFKSVKSNQISSYADAEKFVRSKTAAAGEQLKARLQTRLTKIDDVVNDAVKKAMAEWGPKIEKSISAKVSVAGTRMGYILRGLREDDANIALGRRRAFKPGMAGAEVTPPQMIAATGFHERFPVVVDIAGIGRIRTSMSGARMAGLFDFLKPKPSAEEYMGKIRLVLDGWRTVKPQLDALIPASKASILTQMTALNNEPAKFDGMNAFLSEGYAAYTEGRFDRVKRLEAYLPTVQKMVSEARALGGTFTIEQANKVAEKDLKTRQDSMGSETFLQKAAPIAAGVGGAGLLTALVLAIA